MRKRSFILISILVGGVLGLLAWALRAPPEPLFQGHTAIYWMDSISDLNSDYEAQASRLWQKLGTQSVPMLIRALQMRAGPLTKSYCKLWPYLPASVRARFRKPFDPAGLRAAAPHVIASLPGDSRMAVPALERALDDEDYGVRMNASGALGHIWLSHEELFPLLVKALRNRDPYVRANMVASFGFARSPAEVVPLLIKSLNDPAALVRVRAVISLRRIDPETAAKLDLVPILLECAGDKEWRARINAIGALGRFGTNAQASVPLLRKALQDRDVQISAAASNSLRQIELEVEVKPPAGSAAR